MKKTKKSTQAKAKHKKVLKIGGIAALAITPIAIIALIFVFLTDKPASFSFSNPLESYLEGKYGVGFSVKDITESGSPSTFDYVQRGVASPDSDPDVKVKVTQVVDYSGTTTSDDFIEALWTKQAKPEAEAFLNKEFPHRDKYKLVVKPSYEHTGFKPGDIKSFADMKAGDPRQWTYELTVYATQYITMIEPSDAELSHAFALREFLKSQGSAFAAGTYMYRDSSFIENHPNDDKDTAYQYQFWYSAETEAHPKAYKITTAQDMRNNFQQIRY